MKIYSRDIYEQVHTNELGRIVRRKVCAPCNHHPCIPLEVDAEHATRCQTQFVNEKGEILGLCECFAHHPGGYDQPRMVIKSYPPELGVTR